jgi:hypothetical protein
MNFLILVGFFACAEFAVIFDWLFPQNRNDIKALDLGIKDIEKEEKEIQSKIDKIVKNDLYIEIFKCQYNQDLFRNSLSDEEFQYFMKNQKNGLASIQMFIASILVMKLINIETNRPLIKSPSNLKSSNEQPTFDENIQTKKGLEMGRIGSYN